MGASGEAEEKQQQPVEEDASTGTDKRVRIAESLREKLINVRKSLKRAEVLPPSAVAEVVKTKSG